VDADPLESTVYGDQSGHDCGRGNDLSGTRLCRVPAQAGGPEPVWFLRQAGRYMQEYREVRKHHTLVEICKQPAIAAEVTITAAEKLGVDGRHHLCRPAAAVGADGAGISEFSGRRRAGGASIRCAQPRIEGAEDRPRGRFWNTWHGPSRRWPRTSRTGWGSLAFCGAPVHAGVVHDRGRRVAELHRDQAPDVSGSG